ncbi:MAG: adaptor protein MecA [Lachnospiraceae bacterium]|nr:adaptor protein MecA [Lachnospiraceae bacterium]
MKFKKVGRHELRCIVSSEEMWESGMQVDDFTHDHAKTEEFIRDILDRAREEIGFECNGSAFSVQVALMADSSVVLTISNEDLGVAGFLNMLKDQLVQNAPKPPAKQQANNEEKVHRALPEKKGNPYEAVIAFESMDDVISSAQRLLGFPALTSTLYKHEGMFYLIVDTFLAGIQSDEIQPAVVEYYMFGTESEIAIAHVKEFGEKIIPENAIEVLATL